MFNCFGLLTQLSYECIHFGSCAPPSFQQDEEQKGGQGGNCQKCHILTKT